MLIRNANTTTCVSGFGVESKFNNTNDVSKDMKMSNTVFASKNIESFLEMLDDDAMPFLQGNGLTITFWIRPSDVHEYICSDARNCEELTSSRTIFTIGWDTFSSKTSPTAGSTLCDKGKMDFQLSISETNMLEIVYRTSDQMFEPCQRMKANVSSKVASDDKTKFLSKPMHIAISLGSYHQEIFVNGKSLARRREFFDANLKHWNPMSLLQFFTYPTREYQQSLPWKGQFFQFSVYSGTLNENQVKSVISEGLPPSQPVSHPKVVHINEDALDSNGTLQQIQMPYIFLDNEINSLIRSLELPYQPVPIVRHYITRFPTRGSLLYTEDGRIIGPNGNLPVLVSNTDRLILIPRKDEHSEFYGRTYTSFDYCVTTNKIIMSSQCTATTISVVVNPVNDPPLAIVPPLYVVYEGLHEEAEALLLTGSDVDKNDFIQNIQITSPPKMGHLFLSVSSFRKDDNLKHGTMLEEVNYTVRGDEVYVEYRFSDYNRTTVQDSFVMDYFKFRVQDSEGNWSSETEVNIQVLSSLSSSTSNTYERAPSLVVKGRPSKQLIGVDSSRLNRTLGFLIKSLPSTAVILKEAGFPFVKNQIIEASNHSFKGDTTMAWANVRFAGIGGVCNQSDNHIAYDNLKYQVVALDSDKEVMSMSSVYEEEFPIVCDVEPISMHFPTGEGWTSVSTFVSDAADSCSGYMFDYTEASKLSCRDTTKVFGLQIENAENLREPVYAVITTSSGGFLSMNQNHFLDILSLVDQPVMRSSIRFISPAENLANALSEIHFQSDSVGSFKIQVNLEYGRCNHSEAFLVEHDLSESTLKCHKTQAKIHVNVQKNIQEVGSSHYPFPWFPLLVIIVLGPIFYIKGKARQTVEELHAEWNDECTIESPK